VRAFASVFRFQVFICYRIPAFILIRFVCAFASVFGLLRDPVCVCDRFRFPAFNVCVRYRFSTLYVTQFPPSAWFALCLHSLPFSGLQRDLVFVCVTFRFLPSTFAFAAAFRPSTWSGSYVRSLSYFGLQRIQVWLCVRFRFPAWDGSYVTSLPFSSLIRFPAVRLVCVFPSVFPPYT